MKTDCWASTLWRWLGASAIGLAVLASPVWAREAPPAPHREETEGNDARGEEQEHANELAIFLGGTSEEDETNFTLGAEYERHFSKSIGIALVAEYVDNVDAWVFVAPITIRPSQKLGLKFYAGPGLETKEPEFEHEGASETLDSGRETFFVVRTGVGWAFELGRVAVTPQVEFDFVHEHDDWKTALVFGVAVGFGF